MKHWSMVIWFLICISPLLAQEKKWESRIELSYVKTSGNTDTETISGKYGLNYGCEKNRFSVKLHYMGSRNDGASKADKWTGESRYERVFTGSFFGFLGLNYLRDRFAGFDHRISVGPGLGLDLVSNEKHLLKISASAAYDYETYARDTLGSDQFISSNAGLNYEWKIRKNVTLKSASKFNLSLKNTEKYYFTQEISCEAAMSTRLSLGVSYALNYQNLPPVPDIKKTDTTFLTSLIVNL